MTPTLVIRGGLVLLPDGTTTPADVAIADGTITAVGAVPPSDAPTLDARNCLVAPGLTNAHTHSPSNLTRGTGDGLSHPAFMWLNQADTANRTPREITVSALLGCVDMLLSGTTSCIDHFPEQNFGMADVEAVVAAYRQAGFRAAVALRLFDGAYTDIYPPDGAVPPDLLADLRRVDPLVPRPTEDSLALCDAAIRRFHDPAGLIAVWPAISNPIRCSDTLLQGAQALAEQHDTGLHMHLLETRIQGTLAQARYNRSQVEHLDDLGLLSPRLSTAHTVWVDDADIALLAERGVVPAHNPDSNLKIGAGVAPVPAMLAAGVRIAVGTDGASTAYVTNLQHAMRMATLVHRGTEPDRRRWVTVGDAFRMATEGGAAALQQPDRLGRVAPGAAADIVLYDLDHPSWTPVKHALEQFVYGEAAPSVRDVVIAGRLVVRDRRILTFDAPAIMAEARALLPGLQARNASLYAAARRMAELVP